MSIKAIAFGVVVIVVLYLVARAYDKSQYNRKQEIIQRKLDKIDKKGSVTNEN
jgi:F0F1-type ATP synthase membrane subunit b/b'